MKYLVLYKEKGQELQYISNGCNGTYFEEINSYQSFETEEEAQNFACTKKDCKIVLIGKEIEVKKFDFDKILEIQQNIIRGDKYEIF